MGRSWRPYGASFNVNSSAAKVLDLSDPAIARAWGYRGGPISSETQQIGEGAGATGFNAIRFTSERGTGSNLAILDNFNEILTPQMVSPVK